METIQGQPTLRTSYSRSRSELSASSCDRHAARRLFINGASPNLAFNPDIVPLLSLIPRKVEFLKPL